MTTSTLVKSSTGNYEVGSLQVGDGQFPTVGSRFWSKWDKNAVCTIIKIRTSGKKPISIRWDNGRVVHCSEKFFKDMTRCSPSLTCVAAWAQDSHMQESSPEDLSCKDSAKLTNSAATDSAIASPMSPSTPTCENLRLDQEQQTSSQLPHHANPSQLKENVWEALTSETVSQQCCDKLEESSPNSPYLKTCLDCYQPPLFPETNPAHILNRCSGSFMAVGTMRNGLLSEQPSTVLSGQEKDSCLLPRPGALSCSGNGRPPGNTKSEAAAKKLGIIQKNEVYNPEWLEVQFGLPVGWTSPQEHRAATALIAPEGQHSEIVLTPDWQQLPLEESSTSIPSVAKKSDCWYTPPHIVDLVIQVLGEIDLDPCADDKRHIPAALHYTATDDGLQQQWSGRVFMNPPYSCPGVWMNKLQSEVESGRVKEAIALVPAATDTNWLSPVLKSQPVCFWKGRIKFLDVNYQPKLPARQSHCLVYWGENWQKFKEVFEEYGFVSVPNSPSTQLSDSTQVLGESLLPSISPSTQVQGNDQVLDTSLLLSIPPDTQASNDDEVLGESLSPSISPSTQLSDSTQVLGESSLPSNSPSTQLSDSTQVLGESLSPSNSPSTQRKHGEGSGNLSWGYANANSAKKKPIKQLYFEWEYGGVRGKTYVRSHLKEQVIALNEAKVPVTEILKLLTYNPKVKRVLYLD